MCLQAVAAIRADHVADVVNEYFLLARLIGFGLYSAVFAGMFYVAFEPFVRRRWPMMLIGWTRVLSGRFRDPIVGRDVLVGCVFGATFILPEWLAFAAENTFGGSSARPLQISPDSLRDARHVIALLGILVSNALALALGGLLLLRVTHMVVKITWLAVAIWLALVVPSLVQPNLDLRLALPAALVASALGVFVLYRFGLLAFAVALLVSSILTWMPTTFDASAWYAGRSSVVIALLVALALFGLRAVTTYGMRGVDPRA